MTFGILDPAGALGLAAVAVLVALHLYDRRRRVIPVATLFLWKRIPASPLDRRRFRPDLLFLAQLLLLLALVGGSLRPYVQRAAARAPAGHLVLVLDVSASMQVREAGETRFDTARGRARALVEALAAGDDAMLVTAADRTHVVLGWTADHDRVRERLDALAPLDTPTRLGPALELALGEARATPGTRVAVFTDLPRDATGIPADGLAAVDWVQIGRTDDNLAIAGVVVDQPPFGPLADVAVTVLVKNYGHTSRSAVLEASVEGEPWMRRPLVLGARASEPVLLTGPRRSGVVALRLVADDALPVDNRALAWIAPADPLDLLVVTDSREVGAAFEQIGRAIEGGRVEVVNRARYEEEPLAGRRAAVFDGFAPPSAMNALYVAPPSDSRICPGGGIADRAAVVDWEVDHPAVGGLQGLQGLGLARVRRLATPAWGASVVLAAARDGDFPLLVLGEVGGRRVACLGATLGPSLASSDGLPLLLLTLGTLRWLSGYDEARVLTVETGVPTAADFPAVVPAVGLRVAGDPPVVVAERAGLHRLGDAIVLANLFDDRESDVGREGDRTWPASTRPPVPSDTAGRHEVDWWLYLAAAALLGLEWVVWLRREPA
ncbi:MAG: VWA domain-containing protein [Deltaproteobacteria bacterium]|nr:MAG: VWA domain-containing protein [Deltaproteobacteria bacterium]